MLNMKRIMGTSLISILLIASAVPAFAESSNGNNGNDKDKGKAAFEKFKIQDQSKFAFDDVLKNYSFMDGKKIKVHKKDVKFDVSPVLKDGRTLIPVRAITEAMGADVNWDASSQIVTITSADAKTIIMFYLAKADNGKVTVNGNEVTIDVKPGTIQNRTFVPLRFIAETLGFHVSHNSITGETDCDKNDDHDSDSVKNTLALTPAKVSFANAQVLTDVTTAFSMNDAYDLVRVKNLTTVLDATDYTVDGNKVTIEEAYLEDLDVDKTVLTFVFEDSKNVAVEKTFVINIDQDGVYKAPVISPLGVKYFNESEIADAVLSVDFNEHKLTTVKAVHDDAAILMPDTAYAVEGNKITIKEAFIKTLDAGKTVLTFVFEALDKELVNLEFAIEK